MWIDANLDLAEIAGKLFGRFGPTASPAKLFALTPFELLALFTRTNDESADDPDAFDKVAELARMNSNRAAKGLPPSVPSWLMEKAPRKKRRGARVKT